MTKTLGAELVTAEQALDRASRLLAAQDLPTTEADHARGAVLDLMRRLSTINTTTTTTKHRSNR